MIRPAAFRSVPPSLLLLLAACDADHAPPPLASKPAGAASTAGASLPVTATAAGVRVPTFTDVLAESAIRFRHHFLDSETGNNYRVNPYDHGSGVAIADVDGDGRDDVYLLDFLGPNALYLNRGGMRFEDVTAKAGVAVDRALSVGAAFGDFDRDGDPDLYVTTYRAGNHLFQNRGDGTFDEVTAKAGVGYKGHSNGATWFDYDLDGDLDLFLCNLGKFTTQEISAEADYFYAGTALAFKEVAAIPDVRVRGEGCILYRNGGDGTFADVTQPAGLDAAEWNGDATVADYDLDGDPDLYVSNMFGRNRLYRNRGDGAFEEVTATALGRTSWGGMGCCFFDADGDAFPDLYVVDMHSDMWTSSDDGAGVIEEEAKFDVAFGPRMGKTDAGPRMGKRIGSAEETNAKTVLFGNTFFRNRGDGTFAEESGPAHLETWWPWGIAVGDFNDDGSEDLFVPSGMGFPFYFWPNRFLVNEGGARFRDCTKAAGLATPALGEVIAGAAIQGVDFRRSSRTAAVSDLDGDGDLDMVVNNFNHEPYLYRNDSPPGRSLRLQLRNRVKGAAFGARVKVTAGGRIVSRQLANAQGYLAQSSAILHVGLGDAVAVDRVEIFWPGSTTAQVVEHPAIDRVVMIDQP